MPKTVQLPLGLHENLQKAFADIYPTVDAYLISRDLKSVPEDTETGDYTKQSERRQAEQALLSYIRHHLAPQPINGVALRADVQFNSRILPSGCNSLDELLLGGVREGHVTEFVGDFATGKTQICLQVTATTACRGEAVLYVDTNGSFSAARLSQLCQGKAQSPDAALQAMSHVRVRCCHDIHALLALLHTLRPTPQERRSEVRLLILDSLSSLVSPILGGQQSKQGHALMTRLGTVLKQVAAAQNLAVIITNHLVADGSGSARPALGESWRNQPHTRVLLSRQDGPPMKLRASLLASTLAPTGGGAAFQISQEGLVSS